MQIRSIFHCRNSTIVCGSYETAKNKIDGSFFALENEGT